MTNVNRVINTETYSQDNVDTTDDVNSDVPEVEEAHNVHQCQDHSEEDHERDSDVGQQDDDNSEDSSKSQANVPPQFITNNFICLPGSIHLMIIVKFFL